MHSEFAFTVGCMKKPDEDAREQVKTPKRCPVCGFDHIKPIPRQALVKFEGETEPVKSPIAFRCGRGHTFIVIP